MLAWTWDAIAERWIGSFKGTECYVVTESDDGEWDCYSLTAYGRLHWFTFSHSAEAAMKVCEDDCGGY